LSIRLFIQYNIIAYYKYVHEFSIDKYKAILFASFHALDEKSCEEKIEKEFAFSAAFPILKSIYMQINPDLIRAYGNNSFLDISNNHIEN
jgi:outer membrane phospholipase A